MFKPALGAFSGGIAAILLDLCKIENNLCLKSLNEERSVLFCWDEEQTGFKGDH